MSKAIAVVGVIFQRFPIASVLAHRNTLHCITMIMALGWRMM
jgi:hypothetical protein